MTKSRIAKFVAAGAGFAMALGVALPVSAQTTQGNAEIIAQLILQIKELNAKLVALQGGVVVAPGVNFTQNLTLGSTGSEVGALQQVLVSQNHLTMPAGVAFGYFGPLTQAAVAKWQTANGVSPAAGYWGPISRDRFAALGGTVTPPGGVVVTPPGAGISTPGVEGTITASVNSTPIQGVKAYEGNSRKGVLGIKLEAKTSDIRVERVKVQLPSTTFYNRVVSHIYIMDGSNVVGSSALNSSTVVKESGDYFVTIGGMSYVVPKDATRVLTVAFDFNSSIDQPYRTNYTIVVPNQGVRGVDGAGINQFAPSSGTISRSHSVESDQALDATVKISLNTNSPKVHEVVAANGSDEDELDGLELLRFDIKAEKDSVTINDLRVVISSSGSTATTTTVYLYDGSTLIASEDGNAVGGNIDFTDIDYMLSKDSTRTLRVVVDVRSATASATVISAAVSTTGLDVENSIGDDVSSNASGSATGESVTVRNIGLEISLVSMLPLQKGSTPSNNNTSTSTALATFNLRVKAVGGDILIGEQGSTTGAFVTNGGSNSAGDPPSFRVYRGGVNVTGATLATNA
jgi:peptidoglycan hydrolase-like protein with peptidoglycan-binding domain